VVDAMNIASSWTAIPLSCFDTKIFEEKKPELEVRFGTPEDMYVPHTGNPWSLSGAEVVLASEDKILCLYPYRDSKFALITPETKELICVAYGVSGIVDPSLAIQTMFYILRIDAKANIFS
jgi:DNA/RNA-binding domain of Phe-tRNA-synthetase-like protein